MYICSGWQWVQARFCRIIDQIVCAKTQNHRNLAYLGIKRWPLCRWWRKVWHHFVDKAKYSQSYGFSRSHVWMWELDHEEGWVPKNWCFQTVVLEKTFKSLLDRRRSNQSSLKEISPEYSWEGLMLKLKLQYFGHLMWRTGSLEKTPLLGKIEGRRRQQTDDEMVGWHHWLDGHEFE